MPPFLPDPPTADRRTFIRRVIAAAAYPVAFSLGIAGCARVPDTGSALTQKLLVVSFTVRGQIAQVNPLSGRQNYYFVVVNLTNDPAAAGPVPQIAAPYSNGIAVSDTNYPNDVGMVGFVQYGGGFPDVHLFRAPRDTTNTAANAYKHASVTTYSEYLANDLGLLNTAVVSGSTISVSFDLNRLLLPATGTLAAQTLPAYVQVNIIATDNVPSGSATDPPKFWDAFGDGRTGNTKDLYVTLPLAQTGQLLTASQAGIRAEPADADVVDRTSLFPTPNDTLDITDWQIRIQ